MLREEVASYVHICSYLFCKDIIHTLHICIACCLYECEKYSHITFIDTTAFPKLIIITKQDWNESLSSLLVV